jgi:membrane-associated phospholipid phosphatase
VGFLLSILRLSYVNRGDNTKTRQGMPVWAAGISLLAVAVGIISSELGAGHGFILGVIGGVLFSYGVAIAVVPRVPPGD